MAHARDEDLTTGEAVRRLRLATMTLLRTVTRGRVTPGGCMRVSAAPSAASAQRLSQIARRSADEV